jgi:hypothetical protein
MVSDPIVVWSLYRQCRCEVPGLFGQYIPAVRALAPPAAGGTNRRPLRIEPATLLSLLTKPGLGGLEGPGGSKQQPEGHQENCAQQLSGHRAARSVPPRRVAPGLGSTGRAPGKRVVLPSDIDMIAIPSRE